MNNKDGKGAEGKDSKGKSDGKGKDKEGQNKDDKGKKGEGQSKEDKGKKGEGQNKDDKGKQGEGQNKSGGKEQGKQQQKGNGKQQPSNKGEGQKGQDQQNNDQQPSDNGDQQRQQPMPGQKQVEDALGDQQNAKKNIDKDKNEDASKNQDDAIKKLEEVRKQWEALLRQLREEEMRRLLEALQNRCKRMLALQIEIYEKTCAVEKAIAENPDKKASRAEEQRSLQLSDREQEIVRDATLAMRLLETEGSAVAFPEAFAQVKEDAAQVVRRLGKADVGIVTQGTEQDIIATLKEMVEALDKAIQDMQNRQQNREQQDRQQPNQNNRALIDRIAELKMVRSMQIRVNNRTVTYGRQYPGEQANDPDIQRELAELAQRQQKIFGITNNIAREKNK
jgi:hypothetical protein